MPTPRRSHSPVATIACYGPTLDRATKLVASIVAAPGKEVMDSRTWTSLVEDVRHDPRIREEVAAWTATHGVSQTIMAQRLLGCPHREGIDYPEGDQCPRCPLWAVFDRWTGKPCLPRQWSAPVVLAVLSVPGHVARDRAIIEADAYRDAIVEAVVRALTRVTDAPDVWTDADSSLITDGLFLCARWRDDRVYRPLVRWFSTASTHGLDLLGDVLTQDGGRLLAGVWGGALGPLQRLIETRTADEYARAAGLNALALLVAWGEAPRDVVVSYLMKLASDGLESDPGQVWDSLALESAAIEAIEVFPLLRQAFASGLIDEAYMAPAELDEIEAGPRGATLQELRDRHPPVRDVLRELAWAEPRRYTAPGQQRGVGAQKVGRNDPCPCGSGRKYKKCCGA